MDDLMQMVAVSESTPGPIGLNMATYVGFHMAGIPGALVATFSVALPAFLIILFVVRVLDRFQANRLVTGGLEAMRPAVTGLIAAAGYLVLKSVLFAAHAAGLASFQWIAFALFLSLFGLLRIKPLRSIHPVVPNRCGRGAGHRAQALAEWAAIASILDFAPVRYDILRWVVSSVFPRNAP